MITAELSGPDYPYNQTTLADNSPPIEVIDSGVGIASDSLTQIFSYGFTTRKDGHGFHSGAISAKKMGGALTVDRAGVGTGATFKLTLPYKPEMSEDG